MTWLSCVIVHDALHNMDHGDFTLDNAVIKIEYLKNGERGGVLAF